MPELPEVETIMRGLEPYVLGQRIVKIDIRQPRLRWPIPVRQLCELLPNTTVDALTRRGKYLLMHTGVGTVLWHLGMSGRLRWLTAPAPAALHDHVDFYFANGCLRLTDPRRFGALLWTADPIDTHPLLKKIGPEPLSAALTPAYLYGVARGRTLSAKSFLMNGQIVAGVGNIYANEVLFLAGIHPECAVSDLSFATMERLVASIQDVLQSAIAAGGTTLKDFVNSAGSSGYFQQDLAVYGRAGEACLRCAAVLRSVVLSGRSTVYCPVCQA